MSVEEHYAASMAKAKARIDRLAAAASSAPISMPAPVPDSPAAPAVVEAASESQFTSAQAYRAIGLAGLKDGCDKVHFIIAAACKSGRQDVTGSEIVQLYENHFGGRIELGTISARCGELFAARRIFKRSQSRKSILPDGSASKKESTAFYVVEQQTRMKW